MTGATGRIPRPALRPPPTQRLARPAASDSGEVSQLKHEKAQLLDALRERELALAERDKRYRESLAGREQAFDEQTKALQSQVEAAEARAQAAERDLKASERELEAKLKARVAEVEDKLKARLEKREHDESEASERVKQLEKSNKLLRAKLEQKDKEHRELVARARRTTQHALRSAVLKAEERKRESIAHHQEQSRVLEKELRQLKDDYEARLDAERAEARTKVLKLSEELTRLRRESSLARNEAEQVRKLWKQSEERLAERSKRVQALEAELSQAQTELSSSRQDSSSSEAEIRTAKLKTDRLEKLLEGQERESDRALRALREQLEEVRLQLAEKTEKLSSIEEIQQATEFSRNLEREALRAAEARLIKVETEARIAQGLAEKQGAERLAETLGELEAARAALSEAQAASAKLATERDELSERLEAATPAAAAASEGAAQLERELAEARASLQALRDRETQLRREFQENLEALREEQRSSALEASQSAFAALRQAVEASQRSLEEAKDRQDASDERWEQALARLAPPPEAEPAREQLESTIGELRERLARTEAQLVQISQRGAWSPDPLRVNELSEAHRDHPIASRGFSPAQHQAEHLLFNSETLRRLCQRLWRSWPPFPNRERAAEASATTRLVEALVARVEAQRERAAGRLQDTLRELKLALESEARQLKRVDETREELLARVTRGGHDSSALARLAELAILDRRLNGEVGRLTMAVESLESALGQAAERAHPSSP